MFFSITSYNYSCRNIHAEFAKNVNVMNCKPLHKEWMNFRRFYENFSQLGELDIENEDTKSLKRDCINKNFNKWLYENKDKIKVEKKDMNTQLLKYNKMKQDNGIVRMENSYKQNASTTKELRGKFRVVDDYYCPPGGVKEWTQYKESGWFCIFLKPTTTSGVWVNYIDSEDQEKSIYRIKVTEEQGILFNLDKEFLPFWYSVDSSPEAGARVLEFSLTDEIAKQLTQ